MKRTTIVIFAGLAMAVGIASFATEVTAPDGTVISNVLTATAEDGTIETTRGAVIAPTDLARP